jgi:hypothetical protein
MEEIPEGDIASSEDIAIDGEIIGCVGADGEGVRDGILRAEVGGDVVGSIVAV